MEHFKTPETPNEYSVSDLLNDIEKKNPHARISKEKLCLLNPNLVGNIY